MDAIALKESPRARARLRRAFAAGAVGVPMLFAGAALAAGGGAERRFLLLYMAPFFVAFFAWARIRVDELPRTRRAALVVDGIAIVLGAVRLAGGPVPFSGHMLFFAYSALTTRSVPYLLLVLALAAEATWYKLVVWDDFASWSLGIAVGAALAGTRILVHRFTQRPSSP